MMEINLHCNKLDVCEQQSLMLLISYELIDLNANRVVPLSRYNTLLFVLHEINKNPDANCIDDRSEIHL